MLDPSREGGPEVFGARLVHNAPEGRARRLLLAVEEDIAPVPGQFLQLGVGGGGETYLRRPISIADWDGARGLLELLVLPVGKGTGLLASAQPGSIIDCLGPLGRGFDLDAAGPRPVLVGGGIGAAPLVYLARRLAERGCPPLTFLGASDHPGLAGEKPLTALSRRVVLATEDGSRGATGMITEVMLRNPGELEGATAIMACGPRGMLAALKGMARERGIPAYGSLEEHMACGVGACLGCAVPMSRPESGKSYLRVCADGPVFPLEEVILA